GPPGLPLPAKSAPCLLARRGGDFLHRFSAAEWQGFRIGQSEGGVVRRGGARRVALGGPKLRKTPTKTGHAASSTRQRRLSCLSALKDHLAVFVDQLPQFLGFFSRFENGFLLIRMLLQKLCLPSFRVLRESCDLYRLVTQILPLDVRQL